MKLSFYPSAKRLHLDKESKQHFIDRHPENDHGRGLHLAVYQSHENPWKIALAFDKDASVYTAGTDIFWLLGRPRNGEPMHFEAISDGDMLTFELPATATLATTHGGRIDRKRKRIKVTVTADELRAASVVDHEDIDREEEDDDGDDDYDDGWAWDA